MTSKSSLAGYLTCPLCDAEVPLSGDERIGDQVFCTYCQCPLAMKKTKTEEVYLEEDF